MSQAGGHLRFKALALATVLGGLLPAVFSASVADPVGLAGAFFGWSLAMYLFAAFGTLVAALTFGRGEPVRPAWGLLSASYLVLAASRVLLGPRASGLYEAVQRGPWLDTLANIASSAMAVTGFLLLARAWRVSGLDGSTRPARVAARLAALLVAAALAGPDLVARLPAALGGDPSAVGDVVTDLLDGSLFVVAVPVLRAALGLGGGLVSWPWLLLTASVIAWLGYDANAVYGAAAGLDARTVRVAEEMLRSLGAGFAFSAGVAQRWVMTELRRLR